MSKNKLITVLTPTYNRANLLPRCYECLRKQTKDNFEWLIVDDGSSDNTIEVVNALISNAEIPIRYIRKENGGKHTAVNLGVKNIKTIMTLILDSDDMLTPNAIETIEETYNENSAVNNICGYSFLKQYPQGNIMGDVFPREGRYNFIDWRVNYVVSGDQCDVFFTDIMRCYPFTEYPGERFIGESTSWIRMADQYDMICKNKSIYIAEYLEGGLTKEGRAMRIKCPLGGMEYANLCMGRRSVIKRKIKSSILYIAYGRIASVSLRTLFRESNSKFFTLLLFPVGVFTEYQWRKKYIGGD